MTKLIAIIGCGAVAGHFHLPAFSGRDDARVCLLVDPNLDRARELAGELSDCAASTWDDADFSNIEAAIVAVPHFLHADVASRLLGEGKHVLVEKPMAINVEDCDDMLAAAKSKGAMLHVAQMRRFCPAVSAAKAVIERGFFGAVERFSVEEGGVFDWPVKSDFQFRRDAAGGGVLFDTGAHTVDMVLWLLGEMNVCSYADDSYGGVEADCVFEVETASGKSGRFELSRTRSLRNSLVVTMERGEFELFFYENRLVLRGFDPSSSLPLSITHDADSAPEGSFWGLMFRLQLEDWLGALDGAPASLATGVEGRRTVQFLQDCYGLRSTLELPWVSS